MRHLYMIAPTPPPAIEMLGIVKRFPGVIANDRVDFDARPGEVHTLLGENGAGKSTLLQVLSGLYQPDAGEIRLRGRPVRFFSPRESIEAGIGMVYQHFMLVKKHSVTENVILGLRKFGFAIDYREAEKRIAELAAGYGLKLDPRALVWQLSVGEQQRVEIVKMLLREVKVLILDEPTAVLTPQETIELFQTIRLLKARGATIIFISHKLPEVMDISDRITILRQGTTVRTLLTTETAARNLARLMVGREVLLEVKREPVATMEPVLSVQDLAVQDDRFLAAVKGVSFKVHRGEILGLAGVSGNGQRELAQALAGLRPAASGKIFLGEKEITGLSPGQIIREGFAYIPEDRLGVGAAAGLDYTSNVILKNYASPAFSRGIFLDLGKARRWGEELRREYDIRIPDPSSPVRLLSGGNLQKVILARELSSRPRFLLAVQPTRGLDIGATEYVRRTLEKLKRSGTAIFLISEDLQELLSLSDRIAVIYGGAITATFDTREATMEKLGLSMAGKEAAQANSE
ncbi:MAG: ABC transporter ATP-binding protein [Candidatus Aureabacteria bacterium]|nr:ABC transporter ATP-binding protein [Candidatus Auribacterota bacterium]